MTLTVACLVSFGADAAAQSVVRGTVREQGSSRPLAGIEVSVDNASIRPVRSNDAGVFGLVGLPPGTVALRFRGPGFRPLTASAELTGSDTLALDVELEPVVQRIDSIAVATRPAKRTRQGIITEEEIELVLAVAPDAYEVVRRLRPEYLRARNAISLGDPSRGALEGSTTSGGSGANRVAQAERTAAARRGKPFLPKVSIDDGPLGDLELLRQVAAGTIKEIRFMSSLDAATRYGTGTEGGVIQITIKTDRQP